VTTKITSDGKQRRKLLWSNMVKDDIARATADLFLNEGSEKATMDKIASAIGMTKANLYRYVDSKNDIYNLLLEIDTRVFKTVCDGIASLGEDTSIIQKLKTFVTEYTKSVEKNKQVVAITARISSWLDIEARQEILALRNAKFNFVKALLEEGIAKGEIRDIDPFLVGSEITIRCANWVLHASYFENHLTLEEYIGIETQCIEELRVIK
jgi:AcrR family transcriptional regulator